MNFIEELAKCRVEIEKELTNFLDRQIKEPDIKEPFLRHCYSLIKNYSLSGGKRLRPFAVILAYNASGGEDNKKIILPALAFELYHTYTMILDDLMDEDDFRRNSLTLHKQLENYFIDNYKEKISGKIFTKASAKFAASYAIMLGNLTYTLAKKAVLESGFSDTMKFKLLKKIEIIDQKIYHGQMMDVLMEQKSEAEEYYLEMIKLKTAVLFGACFEAGSMLALSNEITQESFKNFGINAALSFQIQDDILDLSHGKGHEIGSDIKKGKRTLLIIKSLELGNPRQKEFINKVLGNMNATDNEIAEAFHIMHETKAIDYCQNLAKSLNREAKGLLSHMEVQEKYKRLIDQVTDYLLDRTI